VTGPLETRALATRAPDGQYVLNDDWAELVARVPGERFLSSSVISPDARTAGVVVEFQSVASDPLRNLVHRILALRAPFEAELGSEIYVAGDPLWTVLSSDELDRDSLRLSVLMIAVMLGVLWLVFRSVRLALLPVVSVAGAAVSTYGLLAAASIPMTALIAAVPPLLVVIGTAATMHLITAYSRSERREPREASSEAAEDVGAGAFWCAVTTAAGFASFLWSDLPIFRDFGLVAAIGVVLTFLVTFTVIPALLVATTPAPKKLHARPELVSHVLGASHDAVLRRPGLVLGLGLGILLAFALGATRLRYATDVGFGEQSFVLRSVRFIEANFRKPMTTELVVSLPPGGRIYEPATLRILDRIERYFEGEPSTGYVWSFLDFVEEAYRIDRGGPPPSFEALVESAPGQMPIVASFERAAAFWSERDGDPAGEKPPEDRARISVDRAWLDDTTQGPYLERLRAFVDELNREVSGAGFRVDLEGGLVLAELAVTKIRSTQWSSFTSAFASVSVVFLLLLWPSWRLTFWSIVVNVLPVFGLLGLMGWVGIGMEPANAMVAAILLGIVVDDTIHLALRFRRSVQSGKTVHAAVLSSFGRVGEPILITSVCLGLGFAMLTFSRWGGLASFGLLASLGILLACMSELLLLPAALLARQPRERPEARLDAPT
jgi:hypothetical protein